jgi:hypothetical protein
MLPRVVHIGERQDTPLEREQRAHAELHEAREGFEQLMKAHGLDLRPRKSDGSLGSAYDRFEMAVYRAIQAADNRAKRAEATLRKLFERLDLSDEDRARVLAVLHGQRGGVRDGKRLTRCEAELIEHYRATDLAGKQMLRTLLQRLADSSEKGGA